jgi:hypothetical protein
MILEHMAGLESFMTCFSGERLPGSQVSLLEKIPPWTTSFRSIFRAHRYLDPRLNQACCFRPSAPVAGSSGNNCLELRSGFIHVASFPCSTFVVVRGTSGGIVPERAISAGPPPEFAKQRLEQPSAHWSARSGPERGSVVFDCVLLDRCLWS